MSDDRKPEAKMQPMFLPGVENNPQPSPTTTPSAASRTHCTLITKSGRTAGLRCRIRYTTPCRPLGCWYNVTTGHWKDYNHPEGETEVVRFIQGPGFDSRDHQAGELCERRPVGGHCIPLPRPRLAKLPG